MSNQIAGCSNIGLRVDGRWLFRGATFTIDAGQLVAITGPAGVGKSMLAGIVGGIVNPTEGERWFPNDRAFTVATIPHQDAAPAAPALIDSPPALVIADDLTAHLHGDPLWNARGWLLDLTDAGAAVVCATHDPELIAAADLRIDLTDA